MEKSIQGYLRSLQLGEAQQFKNLAMVPIVSDSLRQPNPSHRKASMLTAPLMIIQLQA